MMGAFHHYTLILASCVLTTVHIISLRAEPRKIMVSQENGTDNSTCWNETKIPCLTLNYALGYVANSTFVHLQPGPFSYNLTEHFNFSNMREIGFIGDQQSTFVSIDCHSSGSMSFDNSENITFSGILLRGCGGEHNSTTGDAFGKHAHVRFISALFFVYCKDIVIENCSIVGSPGIGVNMYDVGGGVKIMHSTFENNRPMASISHTDDLAVAGGGVYVEFTFKGGLFPFNRSSLELAEFDSNGTYVFHNCTFRDNRAPKQKFSTMIDNPHGDDHFPFGRGGGLSIFVKGAAKSNMIQITLCIFEDNHALWGGGIFIEYQDEVQNNTFQVTNCIFRNNTADYAGGAIRSGTIAQSDTQQLRANRLTLKHCVFKDNVAILGGGVSHHGILSYLEDPTGKDHHVWFINCVWENNKATMGSAMGLATPPSVNGLGDLTGRGPLLTYRIDLKHCNISGNRIILTEDEQVIGQGAIYSFSVPVIFRGVVNIENNSNTALVIENAALHVFGNVTFRNNTGQQGGALGLYGTSVLMLMPHSQLTFLNNTASERGGAVYAKDYGPPVMAFDTTELNTRGCIIGYNNSYSLQNVTQWQTKVVFKGNNVSTSGGGKSVFASTLSGCRQAGQPRINNISLEWKNTMQYLDPDKTRQIATDAVKINLNETDWHVSPSEKFNAFIQLIDEKNSSVLGVVNLTISNNHVKLGSSSNLFLIQGDHTQVNHLRVRGKEHSEFRIWVNTVAGRVVRKLSKNISLKSCRAGFDQKAHGTTCSCLQGKEHGILSCSADSKHVFLRRGYWGGMFKDKFVTYPCPSHHCNAYVSKDATFVFNSKTICNVGRNGSSVLCGECKEGYSVNLGDEHCQQECSNSHLWLLVVLFIVTVFLVLIILRIELDIFTTYLNAWLYSYQIIMFLVQEGQFLDPFITFIIGVANWRLEGVGTCLFHGMNNLQKLGINYTLPAFVLLLLLVLARIARCRPSCYINRNVSRAFCTLLVLCYTNVTMISWDVLHYVPLNGTWVLYADGNIEFVRDWRKHLPYTIIAFLWILGFVLFLPLLLLFTPWFTRQIPYLNNFRLFFDTFQQCFRDEYRWFAAYYFICRLCILSIALYVPYGPLKRSILEVLCVTIVVICLYLRPYRTGENEDYSWLNKLDAVLLTNLCFVVIFSSSIVSDASQDIQDGLVHMVNVLAYVPLVYLIILVGYYGWNYCCPNNFNDYREIEVERPSTSDSTHQSQPI